MRVEVLFFGMLKDITGIAKQRIEVPDQATVADVWNYCVDRFPRMQSLQPHLRFALNQEFAKLDARVSQDDEIAFLPPVSGGTDREQAFVQLTRHPIDTRAVAQSVQRSRDGAVVTFEGVVRDNTKGRATEYLEYECYEGMAVKLMRSLGDDLLARHAIDRIALVHRLGRLEIGEASVVIAVSAPHRKPAFAACLEAIDQLKATVPIWKKEYFAGGEVWVEGEWDHADAP